MSENLREYRRALALFCLQEANTPTTAGDLLEAMGVHALAEQHPPRCYRGMDGRAVSGILQSLKREGLVRQADREHNGSYGRDEPRWEVVRTGSRHHAPLPPDDEDPIAAPGRDPSTIPLEDLTPSQLLSRARSLAGQVRDLTERVREQDALLDAKEEFLLVQDRYLADLDAARAKVRRRLEREGLVSA